MGSIGGSTKKRAGEAAALVNSFSADGAAAAAYSESRVAAPKARQQTANPNTLRQAPINNISICGDSLRGALKARRPPKHK
jgi:hypothetical protein